MNEIECTVQEALQMLCHLDKNTEVIITINNKKTHKHSEARRIKVSKGEKLIVRAEDILYQDNDYFGRLSLYGVIRNKDIIHNILFRQLERNEHIFGNKY